ncbi:MAG: rhodanese-like domain-containing protein [Eubacterium sp.]|nr:rhodanese-like domain-containing protein [Eubacterium sp.]
MGKFQIVNRMKGRTMAESGDFLVIDLREKELYDLYHLNNAISMPDATIDEIERLNKRDAQWLLYCERGNLSFRLASKMVKNGYRVYAIGEPIV